MKTHGREGDDEKKKGSVDRRQSSEDFDILELVRARSTQDYVEAKIKKYEEAAVKDTPQNGPLNTIEGVETPLENRTNSRLPEVANRKSVRAPHAPEAPAERQQSDQFDILKVVEMRARAALQEEEESGSNNMEGEQTHSSEQNKHGIPILGVNGHQTGAYLEAPGKSVHRCDDPRFSLLGVQAPTNQEILRGSTITTDAMDKDEGSAVQPNGSLGNTQQHQGVSLVQANPIMEDSGVLTEATAVDLHDQEQKDLSLQKERRCKCIGGMLALFSCLVLSVALGVNFGKSSCRGTPTLAPSLIPTAVPSLAPTSFFSQILQDLPNSTLHNIYNLSTPQGKANVWMMGQPELQGMDEWRVKQIFALATTFYALNGPRWPEEIRDHWLILSDRKSECHWFSSEYGFFNEDGTYVEFEDPKQYVGAETCNELGEFQALVLDGFDAAELKSFIPPEIALLTKLAVIALSFNGINATLADLLPSEFFQLTNLSRLYLMDNNLYGKIPSELGVMTNLKEIIFDYNALSGTIPSELGLIGDLRGLGLSYNNLSGTIPSELGLLTKVQALWLRQNALTGTIPKELDALVVNGSLASLALQDNNLSETASEVLCSLGHFDILAVNTSWLDFDCNEKLCGCDWCPCPEGFSNGTK